MTKTVLSGLGVNAWGALEKQSPRFRWLGCDDLLLLAPNALADVSRIIWLYRSPVAFAFSAGKDENGVQHWTEIHKRLLNSRRQFGSKLCFLNIDRSAASQIEWGSDVGNDDGPRLHTAVLNQVPCVADSVMLSVAEHLLEWGAPETWEVYQALESLSPRGEQELAGLEGLSESDVLDFVGRLGALANPDEDKLQILEQENELLLIQLHQVQEELERYYLRLTEVENEKANKTLALADSSRQLDALRFQLESTQSELRRQLSLESDLSVVSTRRLLSTLASRVRRKLLPASIRRYRAGRVGAIESDPALDRIRQSRWFDAKWYLATYADVDAAGVDPAEHYHVHGWKEGRNPSPEFDTQYYLASNQDVNQAGVDPLLHFIEHGAVEGRRPVKMSVVA